MSRSKHQTLKSIANGQSKQQVTEMFEENDHDAMQWLDKGIIKKAVRQRRSQAKSILVKPD